MESEYIATHEPTAIITEVLEQVHDYLGPLWAQYTI